MLDDGTIQVNPDYISKHARECIEEMLARVRQGYLDHLDMLNKANDDLEAKIHCFTKLCELGNQEITLQDMSIESIV